MTVFDPLQGAAPQRRPPALAEPLPGMVAHWTRDLRCSYANRAWREFYGRGAEVVVGRHLQELLGSQACARLEGRLAGVLAGTPQAFEDRLRRPEGGAAHLWVQLVPEIDGGVVCGFQLLVTDITRFKRAQLALERTTRALDLEQSAASRQQAALIAGDRRYRALFDNMQDGAAQGRVLFERGRAADFELIDVNAAFATLSGVARAAGRRLGEVWPELVADDSPTLALLARVGRGGPAERTELHLPRRAQWLVISACRTGADEVALIFDDISDRKRAEAAVALAHERFERLSAANIVGIAVGSADGRLSYANDHYLALLGCTRADFESGKLRWTEFTAPEYREADARALAQARASGSCMPYEKEYRRRDGTRCTVDLALAMLPGPDPQEQFLAIAIDTSARKRGQLALERVNAALAERRREAEDANRAKTNFLSLVNHELRTPVHTLLGYLRLLRRRGSGAQLRQLEIAERSGVQLERLINDLLEFSVDSREAKLMPAPVSLRELVAEVEAAGRVMARATGNTLEVHVDGGLPDHVRVDAQRLLQVLQNLLANACKYTRAGRVDLVVAPLPAPAAPARCRIAFGVEDTGSGIEAGELGRIFEAFQRGSSAAGTAGLGLGLAIARHWVEAMGGRLDVASVPGRGSRFSFALELPVVDEGPPPRESDADIVAPPASPAAPATLLVVDDIAANRAFLRDLCEDWGYRVVEAEEGQAALEQCRVERPDALLVDQFMPGVDGWGLLERLRADPALAALPVALVSASSPQPPPGLAPGLAFDACFGKPIDFDAVERFLARRLGPSRAKPVPPPATPARLSRPDAAELATAAGLLELGLVGRIEQWAQALAAREPDWQDFAEQTIGLCRNADLQGLAAWIEDEQGAQGGGRRRADSPPV